MSYELQSSWLFNEIFSVKLSIRLKKSEILLLLSLLLLLLL